MTESPSQKKLPLTDLDAEEIALKLALKPFQGRQIFRWLHAKRIFDFESMTDLSKAVRLQLAESACPAQLRLLQMQECPVTGTKKALFELMDGETVESVLLRDRDRTTLCLSTQVGCVVKCSFCATGQSGFKRNLSPGEIVEQALHLLASINLGEQTPNIVYMGMGEPFLNYDAVRESIRLLMADEGVGVGARKITVSTAGEVPGIRRFTHEDWQVRLAISLHAANDELRSELVPLNRRYPLATLMDAVREYADITGRMVGFEWVLLKGVNDSAEQARELAGLLRGIKAAVNVIPYNPVEGASFSPPSARVCEAFLNALTKKGIQATLRHEKGQQIDAACGQLRRRTGALR